MSESTFIVFLIISAIIHFMMAALVISRISQKIAEFEKTKTNKYVKKKINELESQKTLVLLVPIIGPIIGYGLLKGAKPVVPERSYRANSPGETESSSEGD